MSSFTFQNWFTPASFDISLRLPYNRIYQRETPAARMGETPSFGPPLFYSCGAALSARLRFLFFGLSRAMFVRHMSSLALTPRYRQ